MKPNNKTSGTAAPQDTNIADTKRQSAASARPVDETYPGGLKPEAVFPKTNESLPPPDIYSRACNHCTDFAHHERAS